MGPVSEPGMGLAQLNRLMWVCCRAIVALDGMGLPSPESSDSGRCTDESVGARKAFCWSMRSVPVVSTGGVQVFHQGANRTFAEGHAYLAPGGWRRDVLENQEVVVVGAVLGGGDFPPVVGETPDPRRGRRGHCTVGIPRGGLRSFMRAKGVDGHNPCRQVCL